MSSTFLLPATISSAEDLMSVTDEIKAYADWSRQQANAQKAGASFQAPAPSLSQAAVQLLHDAKGSAQTLPVATIDALVTLLESTRTKAKTMTITLAAPVTNEAKNALVTWVRGNIAPDVLVSFKFNSILLGGMVVRFGSRILDWSFRRTILDERYRIGEILNRV